VLTRNLDIQTPRVILIYSQKTVLAGGIINGFKKFKYHNK